MTPSKVSNYLTLIRTGVLNNPILDGALDEVKKGEYSLEDLKITIWEGANKAIDNIHKYLTQDRMLDDTPLITSYLQAEYLEEVIANLEKRKTVNIDGIEIPATPAIKILPAPVLELYKSETVEIEPAVSKMELAAA